jgi:hypothetical protein
LCLVRILFSRGDLTSAEEIIYKIENIARKSPVPPWITAQLEVWQARLWLAQDKLEAASLWVGESGLYADGGPTDLHEIDHVGLIEYLTLARILIAQEQMDEASGLLQRLLNPAKTGFFRRWFSKQEEIQTKRSPHWKKLSPSLSQKDSSAFL